MERARERLRHFIKRVKVEACPDGTMKVTPTWQKMYAPHGGAASREAAAMFVSIVINKTLRPAQTKRRAS
jgi:hypothetical protein